MLDFAIRDTNSTLRRRVLPLLHNGDVTADAERLKQAICDLQLRLETIHFEVTPKGRRERVSLRAVCIRPVVHWHTDQLERSGQRSVAATIHRGGGQTEITVAPIQTAQ